MNADNPGRRGAAMIDRKPLKRETSSGRDTRLRLSIASPAGPAVEGLPYVVSRRMIVVQ
jgi:hypothetical protein